MKERIKAALGEIQPDLVLKGGYVADVFNHRIIKTDVAIQGMYIVGLGEYSGKKEVDVTGKFILPGLVDAHVHIESSLLIPSEYARAVVPHGTTTIIADPHEIVNVCGRSGLEYMIDDGTITPMNMCFMVPSCVPATPFDHAGCVLDAKAVKELFSDFDYGTKLTGLGEMMNYPGVVGCVDDVLEKLDITPIIDGHAPGIEGKGLNAYICGGITTDHECDTVENAIEKVSKGMFILIREGTGTKNLEELIKAVTPYNADRFAFCTDDKHTDEILREGSIRNCVRKAIKLGLDPITAIKMASINPARVYGQKGRGGIAPDYYADIIVADSLSLDNIEQVYFNGSLVAENGKNIYDFREAVITNDKVINTVHLDTVTPEMLENKFDKTQPVILMCEGSLVTEGIYRENADGLVMVANIERHKHTGNIGKAYAAGFEIHGGAVAQTIGHDSHNITVAGDNAEDMALAVNILGTQGGIAVVKNGRVLEFMPLPIGGIMTDKPAEEAVKQLDRVNAAIRQISPNASSSIFMVLCFISLLVIPHLKLSDKGLFDVDKFDYYNNL
ncbi:MAG: adenine deaminase [Firmicutes bacterium]|nr:adenine deaminase [Bacillota bacterium]